MVPFSFHIFSSSLEAPLCGGKANDGCFNVSHLYAIFHSRNSRKMLWLKRISGSPCFPRVDEERSFWSHQGSLIILPDSPQRRGILEDVYPGECISFPDYFLFFFAPWEAERTTIFFHSRGDMGERYFATTLYMSGWDAVLFTFPRPQTRFFANYPSVV